MNHEKQRIWELDALRGFCILCMIVVHFIFDLTYFGGLNLALPPWYHLVKRYGHIFFVLISGICATLASRSFRRGMAVFSAGLLVSYVTLFLDLVLDMKNLRIWFGILHMLGVCMMLYPLFKRLPAWAMALCSILFLALGSMFSGLTVNVDFLFPLGLCSDTMFVGSDYFPLFPGLGWFLAGAFLGKTLYRKKQSLLPSWNKNNPIFRFLQICGQKSLLIYLLHQPILTGLTTLLA